MAKDSTNRQINWSPDQSAKKTFSVGKNYIFAIGIDKYQYCQPLRNAVRDAERFVAVLTSKYAFSMEDVIFFKDKEATRENIVSVLEQLVEKTGNKDNLIIYFSGHGYANPRTKRGAWVPIEAHPDTPSEYINNSTIIDYIKDIPTLHTFLISDSCFSGKLFAQFRDLGTQGHYHKIYQHPSRWGLSSGGDEVVADGHWGGNSPFATHLINFLQQNTEPLLSVSELITKVQRAVGINHPQQPVGNRIYNVGDTGQGQFVFRLKDAPDLLAQFPEDKQMNTPSPISSITVAGREANAKKSEFIRKGLWAISILVLIIVAFVFVSQLNSPEEVSNQMNTDSLKIAQKDSLMQPSSSNPQLQTELNPPASNTETDKSYSDKPQNTSSASAKEKTPSKSVVPEDKIQTFKLSGVVESSVNQALSGVSVKCLNMDCGASVSTNNQGEFSLSFQAQPHEYLRLRFTKEGFEPIEKRYTATQKNIYVNLHSLSQ